MVAIAEGMSLRLRFDRGTLRLDGAVHALSRTDVLFDSRSETDPFAGVQLTGEKAKEQSNPR